MRRGFTRILREVTESERQRVHQPAKRDGESDERGKHLRAGPQLRAGLVAQQHREDNRHQEREDRHQQEMACHLRPMAMSNASRMTRKFSRPATMRKVLPYSCVTAVTVPCPAPARRAISQGTPRPMLAMAASAAS